MCVWWLRSDSPISRTLVSVWRRWPSASAVCRAAREAGVNRVYNPPPNPSLASSGSYACAKPTSSFCQACILDPVEGVGVPGGTVTWCLRTGWKTGQKCDFKKLIIYIWSFILMSTMGACELCPWIIINAEIMFFFMMLIWSIFLFYSKRNLDSFKDMFLKIYFDYILDGALFITNQIAWIVLTNSVKV